MESLKKICTEKELEPINKLLRLEQWSPTFTQIMELFDKKTRSEDKEIFKLKHEVQKLSELI